MAIEKAKTSIIEVFAFFSAQTNFRHLSDTKVRFAL
jgi:hypothetical protein